MRCEVRKPPRGGFLRVATGRLDEDSPIEIGRHFFFDDIPVVIEALIRTYEETMDEYVSLEIARVERARERDMQRIQERIANSKDPNDWRRKLLELKNMMERKKTNVQEISAEE